MRWIALSLLLASATADAQELPAVDSRIVAMPVKDAGLLHLKTAPDVTQAILFAPGERIASVILSEPSLFFINVAGTADSLALRAASPSALGMMSVRTNMRTYEFELMAGPSHAAPAVVRLTRAPQHPPVAEAPPMPIDSGEHFEYRLSGSRALRPTSISDDGQKTYIEWAGDSAMPATFALGPTGEEQMVDGYVRGGIFTIDRVYETLIFRIDKERAKARRQGRDDDHG